jgi:hypothetical protein
MSGSSAGKVGFVGDYGQQVPAWLEQQLKTSCGLLASYAAAKSGDNEQALTPKVRLAPCSRKSAFGALRIVQAFRPMKSYR